MIVHVFIPAEGSLSLTGIAPGSAIVGTPNDGGRITVYYEGNLYGAENLKTYEEKLLHAADRLRTRYPTVAMRSVTPDQLVLVGTYDTDTRELVHDDSPAFREWRDAQ